MTSDPGPLQGLMVVDLSTTMASVYTSLVFADFGAEVIQIEPPGGSLLRLQAAWPFWMRGKQSIELDLTDADDLAVARDLVAGADVVIDGFRPGTAAGLGLDHDDLRDANPGLVYTSITPAGRSGPLAQLPPYEALVMAKLGGTYGRTPSGREGPVMLVPHGATFAVALLAVQGTMAALHERSRSGYGQRVDATMLQGLLAQDPWAHFLVMLASRYPSGLQMAAPRAPGRATPGSWLSFGLITGLTADDRWMQFAHATPRQFEAFLGVLGLAWIRDDPEMKDAPDSEDEDVRDRLWTMMLEVVRSKTVAEWQEVFDADDQVFAELFLDGTQLFDHPQMVHDDHVASVEVAGLGTVREPDVLVQLSKTPGSAHRQVPGVGEHSALLRARGPREAPVPDRPAPTDRPPLADITVVDIGSFYAGPFGSAMWADLGARVIKVEALAGDPIRFNMPLPESAGVRVTQGKESVAVDVFTDEGKAIVVELIRRADVVLHSYRGGVAARMGLDASSMFEINPDLVYHHGVGYGIDGPYCRRAAYAPTIAAASGFARRSGGGGPEGQPLSIDEIKDLSSLCGGAQAGHPDGFAALGVAAGMAVGLVARDRGAGGQETLTSMLSTMSHVLSDIMIEYPGMPAISEVDDDWLGFGALYRLYEAEEGWVMLCVTQEDEWAALSARIPAQPSLSDDPRFSTPAVRRDNDDDLADVLAAMFATRPAAAWEAELLAANVGCVEVGPPAGGLFMNLFQEGGIADELGLMTTVHHPIFDDHLRTKALVSFSRSTTTAGPGALIGQHTDAVLAELGYDEDRISALRAAGIVGG